MLGLGPMILVGIFSRQKPGVENVYFSLTALIIFLISQAGYLPTKWLGLQCEMVWLIVLAVLAVASVLWRRNQ